MNKAYLYVMSALVLGSIAIAGFLAGGDTPDGQVQSHAEEAWDAPVTPDNDVPVGLSATDSEGIEAMNPVEAVQEPREAFEQEPTAAPDQHMARAFPSSERLNPEEIADADGAMDLHEQAIMDEVQRLESERADLQASGALREPEPLSEAQLQVQRQELEQVMLEEMRRLEQGEHITDNAMPDNVPLPPQPAE